MTLEQELQTKILDELDIYFYLCNNLSSRVAGEFCIKYRKYRIFLHNSIIQPVIFKRNVWWIFKPRDKAKCYKFKKQFIKNILNKTYEMKTREEIIVAMADALIKEKGKTTTLEIKNQLIDEFSEFYWSQSLISKVMTDNTRKYSVEDNGTYKIFFPKSKKTSAKTSTSRIEKVSLTKLATLVDQSRGKFVTIVHTKESDGSKNLMNCQILTPTVLGTILVKEQGNKKSFYPKSLLEVRTKGVRYVKK